MRRALFALCIALPAHANAQRAAVRTSAAYKDSTLAIDARVHDLLGRMTLEEKFWQLWMVPGDLDSGTTVYEHGVFGLQVRERTEPGRTNDPGAAARRMAEKLNSIQRFFVDRTRLGIPIIPFEEAVHGLYGTGTTMFPAAIGLAATWDTALMGAVASAIAAEARTRGVRQVLSPVINIANDVRWGRVEETYGEDPWLSSAMAIAFVRPFERMGVVTTPKHFVANVGEGGRDSYPIDFDERLLDEEYFPPFKAAIQEGGARSVMASYNSVNGLPATANEWLLTKVLRDDWKFRGVVIGDQAATGGAQVLHFTSPDNLVSTKQAIEAGLDVIFQSSVQQYRQFWPAFERGMIAPRAIDRAVSRVLRLKFELGLFEHPYVDADAAASNGGSPEHRALALESARASITLLKNEGGTLPLRKSLASLAVIGTDAERSAAGRLQWRRKQHDLDRAGHPVEARRGHTRSLCAGTGSARRRIRAGAGRESRYGRRRRTHARACRRVLRQQPPRGRAAGETPGCARGFRVDAQLARARHSVRLVFRAMDRQAHRACDGDACDSASRGTTATGSGSTASC